MEEFFIDKKTTGRNDHGCDILALLAATDGYVSGTDLSRKLKISRTAVWKRVAALRREGCLIEASTRKGYRLLSRETCYGKLGIQSFLKTSYLGCDINFYQTVESTNNVLKSLAHAGAAHGTVVIADEQTQGRGRLGRDWTSTMGKGIWMSVLLRPELHPGRIQSMTLAAAVSVCRAIEPLLSENPGIKWPNDILVGGKKVCGILTELSAEVERVSWVIVGIGLNTHSEPEDFPAELRRKATSVKLHMKRDSTLDRSQLAAEILNQLEPIYDSYVKNGPDSILSEWRERSVTLGKRIELINGKGMIRALALDIGEDGSLMVKLEDGSIRKVLSGEISLGYDNS